MLKPSRILLLAIVAAHVCACQNDRVERRACADTATKCIDPEFDRRFKKTVSLASPLEIEATRLMDLGRYSEALALFDQSEGIWRKTGIRPYVVDGRKIECLFRLGRYGDVLSLRDQTKHSRTSEAAILISELKTGGRASGQLSSIDGMVSARLEKPLWRFLPAAHDAKGAEAALRVMRGVDFLQTAQYSVAKDELSQADRLFPENPTISYFMAKVCLALDDQEGLRKYALQALPIGGAVARDMARYAPA